MSETCNNDNQEQPSVIKNKLYFCCTKKCQRYYNKTTHNNIRIMNTDLPMKKTAVCNHCGTSWIICTICKKRFTFKNRWRANQHFTIHHNCTTPPSIHPYIENEQYNEPTMDYDDESSISTLSVDSNPQHKMHLLYRNNLVTRDVSMAEMTLQHKQFFSANIEQDGKGFQQLISKAVLDHPNCATTTVENLYHLNVAKFCTRLDHGQKVAFADIMKTTIHPDTFKHTRPPHSLGDINKFYTKSKYSIFNALPSPTIHTTAHHAYVTLTSVIDYFLAYGHCPEYITHKDDISQQEGISSCKQAIAMQANVQQDAIPGIVPMILYLLFWSDDFEGAMLRKNKKSVWIKTVTICPPHDQVTSTKFTYVIAIGRKGFDHDEINILHNKELQQLNKCTYRYYGAPSVRHNIPVIVKTMAVLADRPERSSMNHILSHNGLTTKRWGYAGYLNIRYLPSCSLCFNRRLHNITNATPDSCSRCCDWNYNTKCRHRLCHIPPNYPTCQHHNSPLPPKGREVIGRKMIAPIQQTFDLLITASKFCAFNYWHNIWTKQNVKVYMQSVGISESYYTPHILNAIPALTGNATYDNVLCDALFLPTNWTSIIQLDQYIDTPMHLLFQGVIKSVIEFSFSLLASHKQKKVFKENVYDCMSHIKALQCGFCRMDTFTKSAESFVAGWIAEHYVAISRCFVHILSHVQDLIASTNPTVMMYYELMIQSIMCLIYRIMAPDAHSSNEISNYIKCFLQSVDKFEEYSDVISTGPNNVWFSRGNFLSLLNLPDQIEQFGSVRLYWEGCCERHIQYVKPLMKNMRNSTSYLQIKFHQLQQDNMLKHMTDVVQTNISAPMTYQRFNDMKIYHDKDSIAERIDDSEAFSCSYEMSTNSTECPQLFCVIKTSNDIYYKVNILCDDSIGMYKYGQWYSSIKLQPLDILNDLYSFDKSALDLFVNAVAVPMIYKDATGRTLYAFITDSWLCRTCQGQMCTPKLSSSLITKLTSSL